MPDQPTPPTNLAARVAELEATVAQLTRERDMLKSIVSAKPPGGDPFPPLTEEEVLDAIHGPQGMPLENLIAEYKRKLGAA
jgi:hypothetical protein